MDGGDLSECSTVVCLEGDLRTPGILADYIRRDERKMGFLERCQSQLVSRMRLLFMCAVRDLNVDPNGKRGRWRLTGRAVIIPIAQRTLEMQRDGV